MAEATDTALHPATPLDGTVMPAIEGLATLALGTVAARHILRLDTVHLDQVDPELRTLLSGGINSSTKLPRAARHALRLGPDEWLLLDLEAQTMAGTAAITASLGDVPHALVEVTDRQLALVVSGPSAADVLAAGCALPLDEKAFPEGKATRTLVGKVEVVLWRQRADHFHIEVARSFAPYLAQFLSEVIANEAAIAKLRTLPPPRRRPSPPPSS